MSDQSLPPFFFPCPSCTLTHINIKVSEWDPLYPFAPHQPASPPPCPTPTVGRQLSLQACGEALSWSLLHDTDSSTLSPASNSSLCAVANGGEEEEEDSGSLLLALCTPQRDGSTPRGLVFHFDAQSSAIVHRDSGLCVTAPVCGDHLCAPRHLTLSTCMSPNHQRQMFAVRRDGRIVSVFDNDMCVSVC
jgi:hypothetical protein